VPHPDPFPFSPSLLKSLSSPKKGLQQRRIKSPFLSSLGCPLLVHKDENASLFVSPLSIRASIDPALKGGIYK
jgi:hypothetical protein